tara:strand:- start:83378 stop:83791 length:414 start_codon:yes stop_codon:yes gene_type:complete
VVQKSGALHFLQDALKILAMQRAHLVDFCRPGFNAMPIGNFLLGRQNRSSCTSPAMTQTAQAGMIKPSDPLLAHATSQTSRHDYRRRRPAIHRQDDDADSPNPFRTFFTPLQPSQCRHRQMKLNPHHHHHVIRMAVL